MQVEEFAALLPLLLEGVEGVEAATVGDELADVLEGAAGGGLTVVDCGRGSGDRLLALADRYC